MPEMLWDGLVDSFMGDDYENPFAKVITGVVPDFGPGKVYKAMRVAKGLDLGKVIKFKDAIKRPRNEKDVFSSRSTAKKLMKKASDNRKVIKEKAHGKGYLDHFHDLKRKLKGHSFFGSPKKQIMNTKLFSILIEGKENQRIGFFQTFKVLSLSFESAQNHVLMLKELEGKEPKIEEIEELDNKIMKGGSLLNCKVLEKTGKALFNIN